MREFCCLRRALPLATPRFLAGIEPDPRLVENPAGGGFSGRLYQGGR